MASGTEHERASTQLITWLQPPLLAIMCASAAAAWLQYIELWLAIFIIVVAFGLLFGLYVGRRVTPDLDIDEVITRQTRRYIKRHRILGWLWRFYWLPYALIHPHRGISHTPFIGTSGRWIYMFTVPVVIFAVILYFILIETQISLLFVLSCYSLFWVAEYFGQVAQDLLHLWMDR